MKKNSGFIWKKRGFTFIYLLLVCALSAYGLCACGEGTDMGMAGGSQSDRPSAVPTESPTPTVPTESSQENAGGEEEPAPTESPTPTPEPTPETVLGTFTTKILDQHQNRVNNIKIAAGYVMKKQLEPGETFSFNGIVGQRTPEKGFRKARVLLEKGEKGYEYGGGICQLSSTMYNAALAAGMEITERHTHKDEVHYIELGKDAAVSYGGQDFKFINTKEYPVKFRITVGDDMNLTVEILQA